MSIFILHPLLNILFIAIPLALFEISFEKAHGWGSGWPKDKWYAKSILKDTDLGKILTKVTKLEPPLNYHLVVSYLGFTLIFVVEYIVGGNIFLVLASLFATLLAADLVWFSCNWYFDSWKQLLKGPAGSIFWHKDWVKISKNSYLPKVYFTWFLLIIFFLGLAIIFQ
jgi:hypothetical protein